MRDKGKRTPAQGDAAKAATLLSYWGIDKKLVEYVVDSNNFKHGRYIGAIICLSSHQRSCWSIPDYALLLAWNSAE